MVLSQATPSHIESYPDYRKRRLADPEFRRLYELAKQTPEDILRIAERLEPQLRNAFLKAFDTLSRQLPMGALSDLIEAGNIEAIGQLINDIELPAKVVRDAQKAITDALTAAGELTAGPFGLSFTLDNPAVLRWAEQHVGQLITEVTSQTRIAVADIVRRGYTEGIPVRAQARQIRRIVGLTARDAGAVDRFLAGMLEDDVPLAQAEKMTERYRNKLLRRRAENIARTETLTAANQGQLIAWQEAADAGYLNIETTRRVWIATGDDRLCPICAVLDGETVGFTQSFTSSEQASGFDIKPAGTLAGTPQTDIRITGTKPLKNPVNTMAPPAHPSCRCTIGLEFDATRIAPPGQFTSAADAEAWLRAQGIQRVDLGDITRVESLNEVGQAIDDIGNRYPWMRDRFGTDKGLNAVVTNQDRLEHFGAAAQVRPTSGGIEISLRPDVFNDTTVFDVFTAGDHSHYNTVVHELGHVAQFTLNMRTRAPAPFSFHTAPGGPWANLTRGRRMFMQDVSMYAEENGEEFFAELFAIKNTRGYAAHLDNAYWKREGYPAAALKRLEAAERFFEDYWTGWAEELGFDPEDIL